MTERVQPNIFDDEVASYVDLIKQEVAGIRHDGKNVRPYGDGLGPAQNLSEDENHLLFMHPAEHVRLQYPDLAVDPNTQMPITNAQATQILLQKMGPADYVKYVQAGNARALKRGGPPSV